MHILELFLLVLQLLLVHLLHTSHLQLHTHLNLKGSSVFTHYYDQLTQPILTKFATTYYSEIEDPRDCSLNFLDMAAGGGIYDKLKQTCCCCSTVAVSLVTASARWPATPSRWRTCFFSSGTVSGVRLTLRSRI